jgi:thymidylate synthase (FAD)
MKLVKSNVELIEQGSGLEGVYRQIEQVSRTCYKSEDKITEDSAKEFVQRMLNSGHLAMLEHGTLYLHITDFKNSYILDEFLQHSPHSKLMPVITKESYDYYVTTNLRTIIETFNDRYVHTLLSMICEPTEHHDKRYTMKFTIDRGVSHKKFVA